MIHLRRRIRLWAVLWAVLQFALPTGVSYLDAAIADRGKADAALVHVEETAGKNCRPPHSGECALCRFVTHFASDLDAGPVVAWPFDVAEVPFRAQLQLVESAHAVHALSRAPPSV